MAFNYVKMKHRELRKKGSLWVEATLQYQEVKDQLPGHPQKKLLGHFL